MHETQCTYENFNLPPGCGVPSFHSTGSVISAVVHVIALTSHMYCTPGLLTIHRSGHDIPGVLCTGSQLGSADIIAIISAKILPQRRVCPYDGYVVPSNDIPDAADNTRWRHNIEMLSVLLGLREKKPPESTGVNVGRLGAYCVANILVQWNLSITTTYWDTSLPSGAHLGGRWPPRWAPEGRNCYQE